LRRILPAIGVLGLSLLAACDLLLVDPATAGPELQLSLVPAQTSHDVVYGDLIGGLGPVRRVQFRFIHEGVARDTLVRALRDGSELHVRVLLRPEEAVGWLEVIAELQLEGGAPVFSGHGLVNARPAIPRATIELVPIASEIAGGGIPAFTALGIATTPAALAMFASGFPIEGARIDWTSDTPDVVEVVGGSQLVSRNNGSAIVTASSLGAVREYAISVGQVPVVLTGVGPADTTVSLGSTFQGRPFGQDANGHPLHPGAAVTWSSNGSTSVTSDGLVTARSAGAGSVTLSHGAVAYSMQVTVLP
jgi:hypothetical protein